MCQTVVYIHLHVTFSTFSPQEQLPHTTVSHLSMTDEGQSAASGSCRCWWLASDTMLSNGVVPDLHVTVVATAYFSPLRLSQKLIAKILVDV